MTAPRAREQSDPPSPPDRRPPRRGGGSSPSTYAASAAGARRGLARSARALAAAALLALSGTLALPATAQADVLVSNLGQAVGGGGRANDNFVLGQAFSVPSGGGDYTLTSIETKFSGGEINASEIGSLSVSVWSADTSGKPSSSLYTLTNPASLTTNVTETFNAPANSTLVAGTTYVLVLYYNESLSITAAPTLAGTKSGGEDTTSTTDWTIADLAVWRRSTDTSWSDRDDFAHLIRVNGSAVGGGTPTNNAPSFTSSTNLSIEENTYAATVVAVDNDADDDITGYAITGGTDQDFFENVTSVGVLSFDEPPNFEDPKDSGTNNTYVVTVQATSGTGDREMTATQTITVTVTDVNEQSAKPDKPTLAAVTGSSTSLTATWTKPDLDGGPAIATYIVQYREGTTGNWTNAYNGSALTTTITGLTASTSYQVRVRTDNTEALSDWSDASDAVKTNAEMSTPTCTLNTGDLWCGVLTVADIESGGSVAAHGFAGTDGDLDDKTFSVGTNNYTIDGLYVGTAGDLNFDLTGALDAADKGNLELVVGSAAFDLDDATDVPSVNGYLWLTTGLDWSSDTYVTLRLRRKVALSTDATLSGLTVYDGSSNLALSPTFASGTETYTASAAYDIATVTVTASKNQADATIAWLDASDATLADADAMAPGRQVALEAGGNTLFKVKVTAEDGTATKTYTVTVNRASPSCTLNAGDLWCGVVTVGNGTGFDGYLQQSSLGVLSDRTFSVGTNNYTIAAIYVQTGGLHAGSMTFNLASGLTSADRAALVLHLGSTEYEFSDAFESGGQSYAWRNTGLDWSSESFVTLRLRDTPLTNNAPVFSSTSTTRTVAENSAAGTNARWRRTARRARTSARSFPKPRTPTAATR